MIMREYSIYTEEKEILLFPYIYQGQINKKIEDGKNNYVYKLKGKIINKYDIIKIGLKKEKKVIYKNGELTIK